MCKMSFKKETPLANAAFWAARKGNLALLQLLLNSGRVDVDCRDSSGSTALMLASFSGHMECVRELVLQGADINLQRESGSTALFFAAQQGHNDIVRFLFEFGASTEFTTRGGGTALLAASQHGHNQVVETLLKHGANIHDQLCDGATPLFLAAQGGYVDVVRLLLTYGAKANQPRQDGATPLWIASQVGHHDVVRVLLLRGADRDAARIDGTTALFKAATKGFSEVIEELLKFSPALGILKNGSSALHAAVLGGNVRSVALLLEAGANPMIRNKLTLHRNALAMEYVKTYTGKARLHLLYLPTLRYQINSILNILAAHFLYASFIPEYCKSASANELPADLSKNERILRLLKTKEPVKQS